ncbi:LLM class flavin-dependent oxidoreductase [Actinoalloteichus caeruleus]|uniref:Flavin-dependent oxidoreductase, luciferase family (Includes alkanesulfonate monooxygenase SsuD and methylene tetrahydromethanopterin reductase) n=2 Tax=Actinoalloteichus cyanogriseus TaxID=2893586 RepID=A0ABT1JGM3_ACTCY|nr:LLM class flavin-dependent oxidoreductase [Actinoalloteichus caeruleus]MCP2331659.1 Flavin-dependent oxidoreductase, luciferase family (includes alkanesulfonate monooxygenase SsuD and methylene tetrahydromethanopterin reductase) [Actinoalloteichus caeruleus DSM 43889]
MIVDDRATGVLLPRDLPAGRVLDFAREAERFGFGELWVVEDLGFRGGFAQAGAVLAATDRIRVGIGVLPVGARGVAFAAMEAATLAELFPGRVDIGVGHGMPDWMRQVGAWPASPLTLLEEYTVALRALLRGERVDVAGRHVWLDGVRLETPPAVPPPVLAGVRGPRSLAVAGRVAEGTVLAEPVSPEYARTALGSIASHGPHRLVGYNLAVVHDDGGAAVAAVRPALAPLGEPDWRPHLAPLPFADEVVALRDGCADGAEFARRLPAEWVRQLAVVGTPDQARRRVDVLHEAGVTSTVLIPVGSDPFVSLASLARVL